MARTPSLLPRGTGTNRRGFDQLIKDIASYYPKAYEEAYVQEVEIIIKDIIQNTPIDTGAAAGVLVNKVGAQKRPLYKGHKSGASNSDISNDPGGTGWQLQVAQTSKKLDIAIVNPQWDTYLKFLELGLVQPVAPAKPFFVFNAWMKHMKRRDTIRARIKRGRS